MSTAKYCCFIDAYRFWICLKQALNRWEPRMVVTTSPSTERSTIMLSCGVSSKRRATRLRPVLTPRYYSPPMLPGEQAHFTSCGNVRIRDPRYGAPSCVSGSRLLRHKAAVLRSDPGFFRIRFGTESSARSRICTAQNQRDSPLQLPSLGTVRFRSRHSAKRHLPVSRCPLPRA